MLYRYTYFKIESPIEEIWSKSIDFWNLQKGEMVSTNISENFLHRKLEFKHDASGQFINSQFILSLGETYTIEFGYEREENCTYITVEVLFRWFGRDNVRWVPQDYINKWLDHLGYEPVYLQPGKTHNYLRISEQFKEYEKLRKYLEFCPICGTTLDYGSICSECGYSTSDIPLTH